MFTKNGELSWERRTLSFITLWTDFLVITLKFTKDLHGLEHFFHSVVVAGFNVLDFPNFAKAPFTNDVIITEKFPFQLEIAKYFCLQFNFCFRVCLL